MTTVVSTDVSDELTFSGEMSIPAASSRVSGSNWRR